MTDKLCYDLVIKVQKTYLLCLFGMFQAIICSQSLWAAPPELARIITLQHRASAIRLTVKSVDGIHTFLFHEREPMQLRPGSALTLYQGLRSDGARFFSGNPRAALSLSATRLVLNFIGKRRSRLYQVELGTEGGIARSALLMSSIVSSRASLGCAEAKVAALFQGGRILQGNTGSDYVAAPQSFKYTLTRYLQLSIDSDFEYFSVYGSETANQVVTVLNAAEAIYLGQLGISFVIVSQHQFTSSSGNYLATEASQLLDEFRDYSEVNHQLANADLYHLFTAKDSDDGIAGLAYVGPVCRDNSFSYGLSRRVASAIQPLVTAHEIGHGFGATHPEDTLNSPEPSLMTGLVRADQTRFSEFSLNQITHHLDRYDSDRSCISGLGFAVTLSSVRSARRATFRMTTRSQAGSSCSATLYGAASSSRLSLSQILTKAKPLKSFILGDTQSRLTARFPNGNSRLSVPAFFRVYAECEGQIYASSIKQKRLYGYGGRNSRSIKAGLAGISSNLH